MEYGLIVEAKMLQRPGGEDWVGASPHGAAVGVFFSLPFCAFSLGDKERGFCQEFFFKENLIVIVNMFVALLHHVYE